MIFKPEMVEKILAGEKTATRRPAKGQRRYSVGREYAVQPGRGKKAVGRIRIVVTVRERLDRILTCEAIEEGFESREAFFAYWRKLYPGSDLTELVDVYAFVLVRPQSEGTK